MQRVANLILNQQKKIYRVKIPGELGVAAGYRNAERGAFGIIVVSLDGHCAAKGNSKGHIFQQPQLMALRYGAQCGDPTVKGRMQ